jgi:hypothetical protein
MSVMLYLTRVVALQEAEKDDQPAYINVSGSSDLGRDLEKSRRRTWIFATCGSGEDRLKEILIEVSIPALGGSKEIEGEVMMSESSSGVLSPIQAEDELLDE